jgi:hypothetical protein
MSLPTLLVMALAVWHARVKQGQKRSTTYGFKNDFDLRIGVNAGVKVHHRPE